MILGAGIDIVSIRHFDTVCRDETTHFIKKHFTPAEQSYAEKTPGDKATHLAGWYAAKESLIKALESAHLFRPKLISSINYGDIEVAHDPSGRPYFIFHGIFQALIQELKTTPFLSISHDSEYAMAQVILA